MSQSQNSADQIASRLSLIAKENPISATQPIKLQNSEFYIFYSFDLANSTQYKTRYPQDWPFQTRAFFDVVQKAIEEEFNLLPKEVTIKLWKFAGDEVLFYQKITKASDCDFAAPIARRVLDLSIEKVQKEENARELLSVKATIWCARTIHFAATTSQEDFQLQEHEGQCRNLVMKDSNGNLDFLGPEVDAGFRLAKVATRDRLLVSADLAYLCHKHESSMGAIQDKYKLKSKPTDLMRIIAYEKLKGVWNGRSYPIVWFEEDWEKTESTFQYDDTTEYPFLRRVVDNIMSRRIQQLAELKSVYKDRGQLERMEKFCADMALFDSPNEDVRQRKIRRAEIHCAPVCISKDFKVLVAKRPADKDFLPNYWEFGCGQLDEGQSIEECLEQVCREDFGLEMDADCAPIPLNLFSFSRGSVQADEEKTVPGITFAVFCRHSKKAQSKKHSEIRWIDADEVEKFAQEDRVSDFDSAIPLAVEQAKKRWATS